QNALGALLDHGPKGVLTPLQHLRGLLALGHVDRRTEILDHVTGAGEDRGGNAVAVSYRSVGKNNSIVRLITSFFAPGLAGDRGYRGLVIRMNTLSKHLERRFLLARVVAEDPKELRRGNERSRREIYRRAA